MRRPWFAIAVPFAILATGLTLVPPSQVPAVEAMLLPPTPLKPLRCVSGRWSAHIDDSFRIHATFDTAIPLNQYPPGAKRRWTSIVRVEPNRGKAVYFTDEIGEDSPNAVVREGYVVTRPVVDLSEGPVLSYTGSLWIGTGKFTIYQAIVDSEGRGCKIKRPFSAANSPMKLALPQGAVTEVSLRGLIQGFEQSESAPRSGPSRLTVLLDVTPASLSGGLQKAEALPLIASVSAAIRRIAAASVRLICFSLDRQQVLYRDGDFRADSLDSLQRLSDAMSQVNFGTVDYGVVIRPQGHLDLLAQLINAEMQASPPPMAVIFMGKQERFHDKLPLEAIQIGSPPPKFFYLRPEQASLLKEDSVTLATRAAKGTVLPYATPWELNGALARIGKAIRP